jgi:hypothetical protein
MAVHPTRTLDAPMEDHLILERPRLASGTRRDWRNEGKYPFQQREDDGAVTTLSQGRSAPNSDVPQTPTSPYGQRVESPPLAVRSGGFPPRSGNLWTILLKL